MITPEQLARSGSEDGHQSALFCQAALHQAQYPQLKWMYAIPNGGSRDGREATKLVGTGSRSGVWDIFLPVAVLYHGLYIEMKKPGRQKEKNGGLTDDQIKFGEYAWAAGYQIVVCYSWQEAWSAIVGYLEGK